MRSSPLLLALCLVAGAAGAASVDDLTRQTRTLQDSVRGIDERLSRVESGAGGSAQSLELLREVEQLRADLARLRGDAELQSHQIESLAKRQTDLYNDLDQRITELQKAQTPAPAADGTQLTPSTSLASAPAATDAATPAPTDEAGSYESALGQFRSGDYPGSVDAFRAFIKTYPQSALAPNAQYWIGQSLYAQKDYRNAAAAQRELIERYPASAKAPDGMLNLATNLIYLDDLDGAKKTLETLVSRYPTSRSAGLAKRRLEAMK